MALTRINNQALTNVTSAGLVNATGTVLQVKSKLITDRSSTTSATFGDVTGASLAITPQSSSSKIMVLGRAFYSQTSQAGVHIKLFRDSTEIGSNTSTVGSSIATFVSGLPNGSEGYDSFHSPLDFLDSPATTSEITYKLQWRIGTSGTAYFNQTHVNTNVDFASPTSVLTLMEIAG